MVQNKFTTILMSIVKVIIALVLLSSIITGTASIISANTTNLTGVASVAPLIPVIFLIGQVALGGWTGWMAIKGKSGGGDLKDQIFGIVIQYLGIILFASVIIPQLNNAITAAGGPTQTTYPALTVFLGVIGLVLLIGLMTAGFTMERGAVGGVARGFRRHHSR